MDAFKFMGDVPAGSLRSISRALASIFLAVVDTVSGALRLTEEQHLTLKVDAEVF